MIGHVSPKQAGEMLGISNKGVYKLIERRRIRAVRIGDRLWVPVEAVTDLIRIREKQEVIVIEP